MMILSDCPTATSALLAAPLQWTQATPRDQTPPNPTALGAPPRLAPFDTRLWEALAAHPHLPPAVAASGHAAPHTLNDCGSWQRLIVIEHAADSQFVALRGLLGQSGALAGPLAALALGGQNFRGQRHRSWVVVPGNLFLTVAFPVHRPAAECLAALLALPAVAMLDAVEGAGLAGRASIKWVNDVVVGSAKIGGVLTATHLQGDAVENAILGLGLNVSAAPPLAPTPFVPATTSLAAEGCPASLGQVLRLTLAALDARRTQMLEQGPTPIIAAYRRGAHFVGQMAHFYDASTDTLAPPTLSNHAPLPAPTAAGRVTHIGDDLSLHLEGTADPIRSGRMVLWPLA